MRKKLLLGAVGLIAVLAATALILPELTKQKDPTAPLLDPKMLTSVEKLFILDSTGSIELAKTEQGTWIIPKDSDFPVWSERVGSLLQNLSNTVPLQSLQIDDRDLDGVGLKNPNSVTLSSAKGPFLTVDLGTNRKGGGQYVRVAKNIYLIDHLIRAGTKVEDWNYSRIWEHPLDKVASVTLTFPANPSRRAITISHAKPEDPAQLADLGKSEVPAPRAVNQTFDMARTVMFQKKHKLDNHETKLSGPPVVEAKLKLFDGTEMGIRLWQRKIAGEDVSLFVPFSPSREIASVNKEWSRWIFQSHSGLVRVLTRERKEYLEKKK